MNKQILKEYNLFDDISRLNNKEYFQRNFDTLEIQQHFGRINTKKQLIKQKESCQFFFKNLEWTKDKKVYLIMKWLITVHKILKTTQNPYLIQQICNSLNNMNSQPLIDQKYEEYINDKLIKPYIQYLQKLSMLKLRKISLSFKSQNQREEQFSSLCFVELNLVRFATKEFQLPCRQFLGFFQEFYPFLCYFAQFIHHDLTGIFKQLKQKEHKFSQSLNLEQISQSQYDFQTLKTIQNSDEKYLSSPIIESQINDFFSSNGKPLSQTHSMIFH